jgi:hypothetical protein
MHLYAIRQLLTTEIERLAGEAAAARAEVSAAAERVSLYSEA